MNNVDRIEIFLGGRPFNTNAKGITWHERKNTPGVQPGPTTLTPLEAAKRLREFANHIEEQTRPVPPDNSMMLAQSIACHLTPTVALPDSIARMTPEQRADLVEIVDKGPLGRLPIGSDDFEPFIRIAVLMGRIGSLSAPLIPDVPDSLERINLVLRMWAGCVDAGKAIAEKTRSGPNDAAIRIAAAAHIEATAAADPVYECGLETSIIIKRRRTESFSTDWIADGTKLARLKLL